MTLDKQQQNVLFIILDSLANGENQDIEGDCIHCRAWLSLDHSHDSSCNSTLSKKLLLELYPNLADSKENE